jgi:RNA recognition motif-containing protein
MRMVVGQEKDPATVSLYVCDIPQTISKEELEAIFSKFFGFLEVRLARDKNR